jgi:DNA-binding NtrC family response regulator
MKTILCIDDEPLILKALKRELSAFARVLTAPSAAEGLRVLADREVHVVISDLRMPVMSGLELMPILRTTYPDIVRVMLTAHADVDATLMAINEGHVYRFLTKPWTTDELASMAKRCLGQAERLADAKKARDVEHRRADALDGLEHAFPGISSRPKTHGAAIELDESLTTVNLDEALRSLAQ